MNLTPLFSQDRCVPDLPGLWIMISRNANKLASRGLRMNCSWTTLNGQMFQPQAAQVLLQKRHKTRGVHFDQNMNDVHV